MFACVPSRHQTCANLEIKRTCLLCFHWENFALPRRMIGVNLYFSHLTRRQVYQDRSVVSHPLATQSTLLRVRDIYR